MRATRSAMGGAAVLAALVALLGLAGPASAEFQLGGMTVEGWMEAGVRFFVEEPSKSRQAKFLEYSDTNQGPFLAGLQLRWFRPDERYSVELGGRQWGLQDQEFSLRAGRLGLWEFGFEWDQTPHVFSTNARMLATEVSRGVFALPSPRPGLAAYNSARELDEISTRWDTARLNFKWTPTPDLELVSQYTRIKKDGDRPLGVAFGSPGNNFLEVLEPIDQTIHDFRLRGTWARERWQLQFGYTLSVFQNDLTRVRADNPCFANAGACGASDGGAAAPATGQSSLPPDNMAHTFTAAGGVSLPWWRTRLTGNASYSLRLQNDDFLPHTINQALLVANPADLALPQRSLHGNVQTFLLNLNATSRPLRPLTLTAKYRLFDLNDLSDEPIFPGHVVNDRTFVGEARRAGRFEYTRHNAGLDARWQILPPLAFTLGAGWERWVRNEHREVPESDEFLGKAALDWTPLDWLLARATYTPSVRRINKYNTRAHLEHAVVEDPGTVGQGQSLLLRKFDEGERDRQKADLLLQIMPLETLTITPAAGFRHDDYVSSVLGLQQETAWSAGIDVSWQPVERVAFSAGYMREYSAAQMRSRSRPVTGTTAFDFKDFDWVSDNIDTVDSVHAGLKVALIPRVLDWKLNGSYSGSFGRMKTNNPVEPTSGTPAQRASATAKPLPAIEDNLLRVETSLKYHFLRVWSLALGYIFESFDKNDWRTDQLNPFVPGVTSIWLGNDLKNYTAHVLAFTLGYRFE